MICERSVNEEDVSIWENLDKTRSKDGNMEAQTNGLNPYETSI